MIDGIFNVFGAQTRVRFLLGWGHDACRHREANLVREIAGSAPAHLLTGRLRVRGAGQEPEHVHKHGLEGALPRGGVGGDYVLRGKKVRRGSPGTLLAGWGEAFLLKRCHPAWPRVSLAFLAWTSGEQGHVRV